jgi:peroxidase
MMIGNETVTTIDNICMYVHLIVQLGGPNWDVKVGRRDSRTASLSGANNNIPPPTSGLANLTSLFAAQGLSQKDMVALSGAYYLNHQ